MERIEWLPLGSGVAGRVEALPYSRAADLMSEGGSNTAGGSANYIARVGWLDRWAAWFQCGRTIIGGEEYVDRSCRSR